MIYNLTPIRMEKGEPSHPAGGNVNDDTTLENSQGVSKRIEHKLTIGPGNVTVYPGEAKTCVCAHRDRSKFREALFATVKRRAHQLADERRTHTAHPDSGVPLGHEREQAADARVTGCDRRTSKRHAP